MKVLSIGNSFSQDSHRYLHRIASADGFKLKTVNLYIGGCSLSMHYRNMLGDAKTYEFEMNGESTGINVSLKEVLASQEWDVITFQQVSNESIDYATFQPYLNKLVEYAKTFSPNAKIIFHQTWGYRPDGPRLTEELGYKTHGEMFADIKKSISKAVEDIKADKVIPSGEVIKKLIESGIEKVHRDNSHASLGAGRYALGLIWYMVLTGNDIDANSFADFDQEVTPAEIEIIKKCVKEVYSEYNK